MNLNDYINFERILLGEFLSRVDLKYLPIEEFISTVVGIYLVLGGFGGDGFKLWLTRAYYNMEMLHCKFFFI